MNKHFPFFYQVFILLIFASVSCSPTDNVRLSVQLRDSVVLPKSFVNQGLDIYNSSVSMSPFASIGVNGFNDVASYFTNGTEYKLDSVARFLSSHSIFSSNSISIDSMFMLSYDPSNSGIQYLYLIDTGGRLKREWFLINNALKLELGTFLNHPGRNPVIANSDGSFVLFYVPPITGARYGLKKEDRQKQHFFYKFKPEGDSLRLIAKFGQIREAVRGRYAGGTFGRESLTKVNNQYVFSSSQDPMVRVYDENGKWLKDVAFTVPDFKPFPADLDDSRSSIEYLEEYVHTGEYYSTIIHNAKSKYIYRILRRNEPMYNEDGTANSGPKSPWAILTMDTNYNYIGHINMPKDSFNFLQIFALDNNTLLIPSAHDKTKLYLYQVIAN